MPKITLDEIEYNTEDLSERGLATLKSMQFLEIQLQKMANEIAIYRTAQQAYLEALKAEIEVSGIEPVSLEEINQEKT